jgi:hypothetical protein
MGTHGYQDVLFSAPITSITPTLLANDATDYEIGLYIDGVDRGTGIIGSDAQTYGNLVNVYNANLNPIGCTVSIVGGNLRFESNSFGTGSSVLVSSSLYPVQIETVLNLFSSFGTPVPGT